MFLLDGKKIQDRGFEAGEFRYPPGWIALATPEERAAVGIIEVSPPVMPDTALFDVTENEDGSYTATPRDPDVIAAETAARDEAQAMEALLAIDSASIRGIREFLIAKFGEDALMPGKLKTAETQAQAERTKLKPKP